MLFVAHITTHTPRIMVGILFLQEFPTILDLRQNENLQQASSHYSLVRAQHLADQTTQSKRAVISDSSLPKSSTRRQTTSRDMYEFPEMEITFGEIAIYRNKQCMGEMDSRF